MSLTNVAILYGGRSGEHDVSLMSTKNVLRNLDSARFEPILIGITAAGEWHLQPRSSVEEVVAGGDLVIEDTGAFVDARPSGGLFRDGNSIDVDVVFPVLHGTFGEDGKVQGLLATAGVPFVGSGVCGSAVSFDKVLSKRLWIQAGLPTVPFEVITRDSGEGEAIASAATRAADRFGFPVFVKPARLGSSVGITKAEDLESLGNAIAEAFLYDTKVMVEPEVAAREIECSVLGYPRPRAFPPGEVTPNHSFYSYEAKYLDPEGAGLEIPAAIDMEDAEEVQRLAVAAFNAVDAEGMARVDFFLERTTGKILLNEINTIPGFTGISMFPQLCNAAGMNYTQLVSELLDAALARHVVEADLRYTPYQCS